MRKVILVVVAAAIVWSGYWFVGAAALERGIEAGLAELRAAGWRIDAEERRLRGFPNRFDTTFDALEVETPGGTRVVAPFLQILALSYKPNEVIAVFPPAIDVETGDGTFRATNADARGSVTFRTATDLPLDHSSFVIDDLTVDGPAGSVFADELRFATRIPPGAPDARHQNIGLSVTDLTLPDRLRERLDAASLGIVDALRLNATLDFDAPIDRHAAGDPPAIDRIDVHDVTLDWGGIGLDAEGMIEVAQDGTLEGSLDLEISDWRRAVEAAVTLGLIPEARASMISQGMGLFGGGGSDATLTLPLRFAEGRVLLGPVPIGPAPRLRIGRQGSTLLR